MKSRPRILLVTDRRGWAFDFLADELIEFASDRYDFEKVPKREFDPERDYSSFDAFYFFWWGRDCQRLVKAARLPRSKTMTVVSSFNSWEQRGWDADKFGSVLKPWSAVGVICRKLEEALEGRHQRVFLTRHGIDPAKFHSRSPIPAERPDDELVVGWAGSLKYAELKGVPDIIEPAVARVRGARLILAVGEGGDHPAARAYPRDRMVDFYDAIDVYVCASSAEGAPLTLIESGACGRPVITTRVGIAPELVRDGESGFLVDRSVEAVAEALQTLQADRGRLIRMGEALKQDVLREWTWENRIHEYSAMFDHVIEHARPRWRRLLDHVRGARAGSAT
ncbi:MAG: glycosyltransferase family 4 protein [bacterium]|nr:glycosyltransferase family 4 protein [bacterium]